MGEGELSKNEYSLLPSVYLGTHFEYSYWSVEVNTSSVMIQKCGELGDWKEMRPDSFFLSEFDSSCLAQARSVMDWNQRNVFCPACGSKTISEESGYKKTCSNSDCESRSSVQNYSHVRTDAVCIVNVISPDGTKILLGRQKSWPPLRFSCVAGFLEPGESIEECCAREVLEETGVEVRDVQYMNSQPWPFPSQLMVGCFAKALATDIDILSRDKELDGITPLLI